MDFYLPVTFWEFMCIDLKGCICSNCSTNYCKFLKFLNLFVVENVSMFSWEAHVRKEVTDL